MPSIITALQNCGPTLITAPTLIKDFRVEVFAMTDAETIGAATIDLLINRSTSELNTLLDPTTYLDYTDSWIQLVTAPTLAVTSWIQLSTCILYSNWTGGAKPPCASRW